MKKTITENWRKFLKQPGVQRPRRGCCKKKMLTELETNPPSEFKTTQLVAPDPPPEPEDFFLACLESNGPKAVKRCQIEYQKKECAENGGQWDSDRNVCYYVKRGDEHYAQECWDAGNVWVVPLNRAHDNGHCTRLGKSIKPEPPVPAPKPNMISLDHLEEVKQMVQEEVKKYLSRRKKNED